MLRYLVGVETEDMSRGKGVEHAGADDHDREQRIDPREPGHYVAPDIRAGERLLSIKLADQETAQHEEQHDAEGRRSSRREMAEYHRERSNPPHPVQRLDHLA